MAQEDPTQGVCDLEAIGNLWGKVGRRVVTSLKSTWGTGFSGFGGSEGTCPNRLPGSLVFLQPAITPEE